MTQSLSFTETMNSGDERPLPLIVAEKWGFPLHVTEDDGRQWYSIRDWVAGLTSAKNPKQAWQSFRSSEEIKPLLKNVRDYPYGTGTSQFIEDRGLYRLALSLRVTQKRTALSAIKDYLAKAGAFTDLVRRDNKARAEFGATAGADEVLEATIERYQKSGKDDHWIQARLEGIVTRKQFTSALRAAVLSASEDLYRNGTERIYSGLWKRTTAQLRDHLEIEGKVSPRDHMSEYALIYTRLAEKIAADKLRHAEIVSEPLAMEIVFEAAKMIRNQAVATAEALGIDLLTGKSLLPQQSGITREEFHEALKKVSNPNKTLPSKS